MRNLTISRKKSFVGCLGVLKAMIADPEGDVDINGVKTRKLGTIKNGESATFEITEENTAVYIIADAASKSFCVETYPLPAGPDDIVLSGRVTFHPALGNPFEFDDAPEETVEYRRRHRKKGYAMLPVFILVGVVIGVAVSAIAMHVVNSIIENRVPEPAYFSREGLVITLDDRFKADEELDIINSDRVGVTVTRENFSLQAGFGDLTLSEYRDAVAEVTGRPVTFGSTKGGVLYLRYTGTSGDVEWVYYAFEYKGTECFWIVQVFFPAEFENELLDEVFGWAEAVTADAGNLLNAAYSAFALPLTNSIASA